MKIIFSDKCLEYLQPGHPESPRRIEKSYTFLKRKNFEFLEPSIAKEKDILRVHPKTLLEKVKSGTFFEHDTPAYKNIFYYASLAAGAAIQAAELSFKEKTFSLMRPPGHHASNKVMGFCYFNNIAIAVNKILKENKAKKIAILDIDAHHGNGTQDIFLDNKQVLYVSLHQSPFYPGTGLESKANCLNFPLPIGTNEKNYLETLEAALSHIKEFNPDLIAVSAGFDTYKNDHIANIELEIGSYKKIGNLIKNLEKPTFSVLEGGYGFKLPECIHNYLLGFQQ